MEELVWPAVQCASGRSSLHNGQLTSCDADMSATGNAVYEDAYLLGTSLARPVIARAMMKVAKQYKCEFLSHGCKPSMLLLRACSPSYYTDCCLPHLIRHRQGCEFFLSHVWHVWCANSPRMSTFSHPRFTRHTLTLFLAKCDLSWRGKLSIQRRRRSSRGAYPSSANDSRPYPCRPFVSLGDTNVQAVGAKHSWIMLNKRASL